MVIPNDGDPQMVKMKRIENPRRRNVRFHRSEQQHQEAPMFAVQDRIIGDVLKDGHSIPGF